MNLGHTHKTRFGYLLGVFSKFSDDHPCHFYRGIPPGDKRCDMTAVRRVSEVFGRVIVLTGIFIKGVMGYVPQSILKSRGPSIFQARWSVK